MYSLILIRKKAPEATRSFLQLVFLMQEVPMENAEEDAGVQLPAIRVEQSGLTSVRGPPADASASSKDEAHATEHLSRPNPSASNARSDMDTTTSAEPTESVKHQSPLPPPPQPLPVGFSTYLRSVPGDASSGWSSSRRTGRRTPTGSSVRVPQETHSSSSTTNTALAASFVSSDSADAKEKDEAGGRALGRKGSSVVATEPRLSLESCLPTVPPLELLDAEPLVSAELSEENDGHAAADADELTTAQPGAVEVAGQRAPSDDPSDEKDVDTDDDSLVCVSPPSEAEQASEHETTLNLSALASEQGSSEPQPDERHEHEVIKDSSSTIQVAASSESSTDEDSKHQSPLSPVVTLRRTFMTEVHESSPHETAISTSTSTPDEASVAESESACDDVENLTQPTVIVHEAESDWIACVTDAGVTYYYNPQTQESQWTPPPSHAVPVSTSNTTGNTADSSSEPNDAASSASLTPQDALFAAVAGVEPFASQLQTMLQSGANLHAVNDAGFTPLYVACQCGNIHATSLLLYYGARPDGVTSASASPSLLSAACRQNNVELMQLLHEYGAQVVTADRDGNSLLHVAIASQSSDVLLLLLDLVSADPSSSSSLLNDYNSDGETPLHLAVKTGYVDAVRALLRYGAATDVEDSLGRTPLVLSIMENQVECVQLLQTASKESETRFNDEVAYEATTRNPEALTDSLTATADLDNLQAYVFQLLSSAAEERPELHHAVYQLCSETHQRMSSLTSELQSAKQTDDKRNTQIQQLTLENTSVTQELTKNRDELLRVQEQLNAHQLELNTLRTSHQALASRCEMLDGIARTAQEKLRRERAEHNHYEEQMQLHLSATTDENARLVTTLSELEATWSQRLEQQNQQQQLNQVLSEEKSAGSGNEEKYYYTQYGELDQETAGDATGASYEYPQYYSTEGTGTLTPVDEPGEYYYSNENESDDLVYLDETEERNDTRTSAAAPPISPSRVGAVWNKFFENMAVAAEKQAVSSQQQQQQQQAVSNNNNPASGRSMYNEIANASPAAVFMAIRRSNFAELQRLLLGGMAANVRDIGEKGTPLHLACELGDLDAMKLLCEFAADVEVRDEAGNTPLLVACSQGHYECTKFLLQSAASLSVVNANGDSTLHLAAWDGSADCVEILFEYGVDPLATNSFGLTPLANLKTRSPLRHKFDELVDEHPMRRTLVLLEEMEQRALEERDEAEEEQDEDESQVQGPEHHATRVKTDSHKKSSSNPNQADERERSSAIKTSWKDWLLSGFGAKTKREEADEVEDEEELDGQIDRDDEFSDDSDQVQDAIVESEDERDDTSSFEESLHRYEPLRPPPEIEAELLRAKLQLQRPATLTASRSYESKHQDDDDEDDRLTPTGNATGDAADNSGGMQYQHQQQHFVAADRMRMMTAKPSKKPPSAAANLRARYVDTFNPV